MADEQVSWLFTLVADWWVKSGNMPDDPNATLLKAGSGRYSLTFNRGREEVDDIPYGHVRIVDEEAFFQVALINPVGGVATPEFETELVDHFDAQIEALEAA